MEREAKFPALLYLKTGANSYDIEFTSSVPDKMNFILRADSGVTNGAFINIKYDRVGSFSVLKNSVLVEPNGWAEGGLETLLFAELMPVTGAGGCGENNYWGGGTNELQFYILPTHNSMPCEIKIVPRNAIQLGVRLEFTLD